VLDAFIVAQNPETDTSLPYLLHVPLEGGLWLKVRETWPRASRVYCHPIAEVALASLVILERIAVLHCERRGPVVDLVPDRAQNRRAQFVFTQARGRPMIFWQTAKAAANARPGLRIPSRPSRALDASSSTPANAMATRSAHDRSPSNARRYGWAITRASAARPSHS